MSAGGKPIKLREIYGEHKKEIPITNYNANNLYFKEDQ